MTERYQIIAVENIEERKNDILALWKRNLYDCPERFAWLYEQNPLGPTHTWLAIHKDTGKVVGCSSLYPWLFNINGKPIRVGVAVDFSVDSSHRVYGPAVSIQRAITTSIGKNGFELLFVYPNKESSSVFQRAGYILIGSSNTWVKMIKSEYKICEYIKIRPLVKIIGWLVDAAFYIREMFYLILDSGSLDTKNLDTETLDSCDYRFDVLWEKCRSLYPIIPHQDSDYLNWRYSQCKTSDYKYFCLCDKKTRELKCFIIYSVKDNCITIKNIFPFISLYVTCIMHFFSITMKSCNNKYIILHYFGSGNVEDTLKKINFIQRVDKRDYLICVKDSVDDETKNALLNRRNYCFFYG